MTYGRSAIRHARTWSDPGSPPTTARFADTRSPSAWFVATAHASIELDSNVGTSCSAMRYGVIVSSALRRDSQTTSFCCASASLMAVTSPGRAERY